MSTYTGGSISTGKLVVNGNITLDASGANAATVQAVQIGATTVRATTIYTDTISYNATDFSGNLYVSGNMVVDGSSTFLGPIGFSNLNVSGALSAKTVSTPAGFSIDASANVVVPRNLTANAVSTMTLATPAGLSVDASANVVIPGNSTLNTLTVNQGGLFNNSLNVAQSLYVAGGAYLNKEYTNLLTVGDSSAGNGVSMRSTSSVLNVTGITQDLSMNVFPITLGVKGSLVVDSSSSLNGPVTVSGALVSRTLATNSGFSVDSSANVVIPGSVTSNSMTSNSVSTKTLTTPAGFSVDSSANVSVAGSSTLSMLTVNGDALFSNSVNIEESLYLAGGEYIDKSYINVLTVGDSSAGNGVSMLSSGTTLNVTGITQDISANIFPVNVAVNGGLGIQGKYIFNTAVDSSTNNYINIDSSNTSVPTLGTQVPDYSMPIYINGVAYIINLKKL